MNIYPQNIISFSAIKKSEFKGVDRVCVDKFKPPIEKFNTNDDLQNWAGDKLELFKNKDFGGRQEEKFLIKCGLKEITLFLKTYWILCGIGQFQH